MTIVEVDCCWVCVFFEPESRDQQHPGNKCTHGDGMNLEGYSSYTPPPDACPLREGDTLIRLKR